LTTEREHIPALDGLRGLAILFVLLLHLFNYGFLHNWFSWGWMGVDLFFVLSGFLITSILIDTKHKKGFIKSFLLRRALRTLPLYYGVLIIFAFIAPHFGPTAWFSKYQIFFWTHTSNFLFFNKGFFRPLGHFWSLALEEQFYLVWPFIVLVANCKQLIGIAIVFVMVSIGLRMTIDNPIVTYGLPLAHVDGLSIGAIIAILYRLNREALFRYSKLALGVCCLLFLGCLFFNRSLEYDHRAPLMITIVSLFFGAILITSLRSPMVKNILTNKVLLFFGKYSYGMYVFNSIFFHFSNWAGAERLTGNQRLIVCSGLFLVIIVTSVLSYRLFEDRFLRMKKRVNQMFLEPKQEIS
jgi:peptidoglycan/LPS O-acetylase OafA/YrhL